MKTCKEKINKSEKTELRITATATSQLSPAGIQSACAEEKKLSKIQNIEESLEE